MTLSQNGHTTNAPVSHIAEVHDELHHRELPVSESLRPLRRPMSILQGRLVLGKAEALRRCAHKPRLVRSYPTFK